MNLKLEKIPKNNLSLNLSYIYSFNFLFRVRSFMSLFFIYLLFWFFIIQLIK